MSNADHSSSRARRCALGLAATAMLALAPHPTHAQRWELRSTAGLELHNVSAESATLDGKDGIRVGISKEALPIYVRQQAAPPPPPAATRTDFLELLAVTPAAEMSDGTIEIDLAGEARPDAAPGARGFVGVAFRVQTDLRTYDAFYLRPTNGRAEDQERRNHTTQFISHPDWPWFRLREETPGRYESYVDIQPGKWIHLKIEVAGEKARLYVDGAEQPTLIVNDVKSGAGRSGRVALWIEGSTIAHFANLVVTKKK